MTLSAYFMSKSVFDVQGCRALTLALAKLSCFYVAPAIICDDMPPLVDRQMIAK